MDDASYRILTRVAIAAPVLSIGWIIFDALRSDPAPGDVALLAAERAFADARYERALNEYREVLRADPDRVEAIRGKARTLLQQGRPEESLRYFDLAIARAPEFAGTYANRGIAFDRMGEHRRALEDYEYALYLDASVADGPGWITRLLHMDAAGPPTIRDRADYLRAQLALPEGKRLLSMPEEDTAQRPYRRR
jgi:tetratricopeptide (TPR) repeat protein